MDQIIIGRKIKSFRTKRRISQIYVEEKTGMSQGLLSRIESGKTNPKKENILAIAKVLDLEPEETASLFGIEIYDNSKYRDFSGERKPLDSYLSKIIDSYHTMKDLDKDKALDSILKEIKTKLGYLNSTIYLMDVYGNLKLEKTHVDPDIVSKVESFLGKDITELRINAGKDNLLGYAASTEKIQISKNTFDLLIENDGIFYSIKKKKNVEYTIAAPLKIDGEVIGCVTFSTRKLSMTKKDRITMESFMQQISKVVECVRGERKRKVLFFKNKKLFLLNSVFFFFVGYWIYNQLFNSPFNKTYAFLTYTYFTIALLGGYLGYLKFKTLVFNNSKFLISCFILGLSFQSFGQVAYSIIFLLGGTAYPSIGDLFYFVSYASFFIGVIYILKIEDKLLNILHLISIIFLYIFLSFLFFYNQIQIEVLDILYLLINTLSFALSISIVKSKYRLLSLIMFLYCLGDLTFIYQFKADSIILGGYNDLIFIVVYYLSTIFMVTQGEVDSNYRNSLKGIVKYEFSISEIIKRVMNMKFYIFLRNLLVGKNF